MKLETLIGLTESDATVAIASMGYIARVRNKHYKANSNPNHLKMIYIDLDDLGIVRSAIIQAEQLY